MSILGERQREFARKFPLLLLYAYELGYEITFPAEHEKHMKNSLHFKGLAKDINLFKDGKYLTQSVDHKPLGEFWESLGGSWGGRFGESEPGAGDGWDGNHYSMEF